MKSRIGHQWWKTETKEHGPQKFKFAERLLLLMAIALIAGAIVLGLMVAVVKN